MNQVGIRILSPLPNPLPLGEGVNGDNKATAGYQASAGLPSQTGFTLSPAFLPA